MDVGGAPPGVCCEARYLSEVAATIDNVVKKPSIRSMLQQSSTVDADDLRQDLLLNAWQNIHNGGDIGMFTAKVASWRAKDTFRAHDPVSSHDRKLVKKLAAAETAMLVENHGVPVPLEDAAERAGVEVVAARAAMESARRARSAAPLLPDDHDVLDRVEPDVAEVATSHVTYEHLMRAIMVNLSPRQREAVFLYYWHGASKAEVARAMGVTPSGAADLLKRAEQKLAAVSEVFRDEVVVRAGVRAAGNQAIRGKQKKTPATRA